jgi:hypothetical protein
MAQTNPWVRNDQGLHQYGEDGFCVVCTVSFLDITGICPGPPKDRAELLTLTLPALVAAGEATITPGVTASPGEVETQPAPAEPASDRPDEWYRIRCVALSDGSPAEEEGLWLAGYDVNARQGHGRADWTDDPGEALLYPSNVAALEAWKTRCVVKPIRSDGRANRPLTRWTVLVEKVEG